MTTTLLTQHRDTTARPFASVVATAEQPSAMYAAVPGNATTTHTTTVVNPWLGGGLCGGDTTGVDAGPLSGFANKRILPGHLEGMT